MLAIFFTSFMVALSGALMPGPLLTVTIAQTARRGFMAAMFLILGHSLLELATVVGLVSGLGHYLRLPIVIGVVAVTGGIMLLWMGWGMIKDARRGALDMPDTSRMGSAPEKAGIRQDPIVTGIVVSVTNPYWVIWWATVGLSGVTFFGALRHNPTAAVATFYLGHITGDILWYMALGAAIVTGRKLMSTRVYRAIIQVCAGFLIFLGGSFLYLVASGGLWKINMLMDWAKK